MVLSALFALALAFGLFAAMPPAADAASSNTQIDLSEAWFGTADNTTYANWSYVAATNTISITGNGVTIESTSAITGITNTLFIDIAAGVTVTWNTDYEGTTTAIQLIKVSGTSTESLIVSGGTIEQLGSADAIFSNDPAVTVGGAGAVKANEGSAIFSNGPVAVNGGTVKNTSATMETICTFNNATDAVSISAGLVENEGTYTAIAAINGGVTISGGTVKAAAGTAIDSEDIIVINGTPATVSVTGANPAIQLTGGYSLTVDGATAELTVNGNIVTYYNGQVVSENGGKLTVNGNVISTIAASTSVVYSDNGMIIINGNVTADATGSYVNGVEAHNSGTITVNGSVAMMGDHCKGVVVSSGTITVDNGTNDAVTVAGDVGAVGVYCIDGGTVDIIGDISVTGTDIIGIWNGDWNVPAQGGTVNVTGNVTATCTYYGNGVVGIFCDDDGIVNMTGDIMLDGGAIYAIPLLYGIYCNDDGEVTLTGDIAVTGEFAGGVTANGLYSNVKVTGAGKGNITVSGSDSFGVYCDNESEVIVDGIITASVTYVNIGGVAIPQTPYPSTVNIGGVYYCAYTDGGAAPSYVYVAHTHVPGAEWEKDATGHWHECECGDISGFAAHTPGSAATCAKSQTCTVCSFVIMSARGHTSSDWIVDKAATATTDGSRHKECTVCKQTLQTEVIPATGMVTYPVQEPFGTWEGKGGASAKVDGDSVKFVRLVLSGQTVGSANYTVSGNTTITLKEDYLKTLANGTYTFFVEFSDGSSDSLLLKVDRSDGGSDWILWLAVVAVVLILIIAAVYVMLRRGKKG